MKPDSEKRVYDGELIDVTLEQWGEHEREIVEHPGAVAVVAVDRQGRVILVRQLREAVRAELVELPAGTLERGEEPLETAKRELREETGLTGGRWRELISFFTTPGFCRERMTVFVAVDVDEGEADPDDDESVEVIRWPLAEVPDHLHELEDAKTLAGLLQFLRDGGG
jgi:ADP-ribose pyrophosphatase